MRHKLLEQLASVRAELATVKFADPAATVQLPHLKEIVERLMIVIEAQDRYIATLEAEIAKRQGGSA